MALNTSKCNCLTRDITAL